MRPAHPLLQLFGAALLLALASPPAQADTLVLDGDDVSDWVRVLDSSAWKYRDACLHPNALIKFDLDWNWPVVQILSARLELYVERAAPGDSIALSHVEDDAWGYGQWRPDTLRNWSVWHPIGA